LIINANVFIYYLCIGYWETVRRDSANSLQLTGTQNYDNVVAIHENSNFPQTINNKPNEEIQTISKSSPSQPIVLQEPVAKQPQSPSYNSQSVSHIKQKLDRNKNNQLKTVQGQIDPIDRDYQPNGRLYGIGEMVQDDGIG
jgi:hypothetical protein